MRVRAAAAAFGALFGFMISWGHFTDPDAIRAMLLLEDAPPRIEPVGFTPEELAAAWARGNRLVREAAEHGVVLLGEPAFRALCGATASGGARMAPMPAAEDA